MSVITLELDEHMQARLEEKATQMGQEPAEYVTSVLLDVLAHPIYHPPDPPPAWLADIKPRNPATDGTNGLHRFVGMWSGGPSDEQVKDALEDLS